MTAVANAAFRPEFDMFCLQTWNSNSVHVLVIDHQNDVERQHARACGIFEVGGLLRGTKSRGLIHRELGCFMISPPCTMIY